MKSAPYGRLSPEGLPAAILLALLAASGMFTVNIMAVLVTGLQTGLQFTARDAGFVAAANTYGAAAGSLVAAVLGLRLPWRRTAALGLTALIILDLVSAAAVTLPQLLVLRTLQGCAGGLVTGMAFSVIARARVPDRVFGMLLLTQFSLGALGVAVMPGLIERHGTPLLFWFLAALGTLVLLLLPIIPDQRRETSLTSELTAAQRGTRPGYGFLALFLFQASHTALSAYVLDIGRAAGLSSGVVSANAGIGAGFGALGSIGVVLLGLRYGRVRPLMLAMALALVSALLLVESRSAVVFLLAILLGSVTWTFALPLLLGLCASADESGRSAIWSSFVSKLGLATGPMIGGLVLSAGSNLVLIIAGAILVLVSCLAVWAAAGSSERKAEPAAP